MLPYRLFVSMVTTSCVLLGACSSGHMNRSAPAADHDTGATVGTTSAERWVRSAATVRSPREAIDAAVRVYVPTGRVQNELMQGAGIHTDTGEIVTAMHVFGPSSSATERLREARIESFATDMTFVPQDLIVTGDSYSDVARLMPRPGVHTPRVATIAERAPAAGEEVTLLLMSLQRGEDRWTSRSGSVLGYSTDGQFFAVRGTSRRGDSGGPVLNDRGEVVGIVIGGARDSNPELGVPFSLEWQSESEFRTRWSDVTTTYRGPFTMCSRVSR